MDFLYVVVPTLIVLAAILIVWLALRRIRSLRATPRLRKLIEIPILLLVAVIAIAAAASSATNAVLIHRALAHPPGAFYTVNGHRMRLDCSGAGSPTLILDAGLGNDGLIWSGVQPTLAQTTRVCSYDRAGFGWSEPLPPPRDADHIAAELHALLAAAHIDGPIVLMGHSIAGIYIRDYATHYPGQIAGLIFVDGSTPLQQDNPILKAAFTAGPPEWLRMLQRKATYTLGIPRLHGDCSGPLPGFDAPAARLQSEDFCHEPWSSIAAAQASFHLSGQETIHTGPYGALPILIFSQDPQGPASHDESAAVAAVWNQMQENLKNLSTRSRRIIAKGSGHYIQLARPDLIEKEVPLFINQIRGSAPQPTNYGTTITE